MAICSINPVEKAGRSLPSAFHKKKIVGWAERIILRTVELDGTSDVVHVEPTGPIDIPVERRSAG